MDYDPRYFPVITGPQMRGGQPPLLLGAGEVLQGQARPIGDSVHRDVHSAHGLVVRYPHEYMVLN
jgi:hypothetical protein